MIVLIIGASHKSIYVMLIHSILRGVNYVGITSSFRDAYSAYSAEKPYRVGFCSLGIFAFLALRGGIKKHTHPCQCIDIRQKV